MTQTRHILIREYAKLSKQLRTHGVRRISGYAEILVAEALGGERVASGVNRGYDVTAPGFGRIEVKCRQMPPDGRVEQRVQLSNTESDGFDYLAIVIFDTEMIVQGAVLVPYAAIWQIIDSRAWRRISYDQATAISSAINIMPQVEAASQR